MPLPTLKVMLTKLKEMEGMKKAQGTTLYISNGGYSAIDEVNTNKSNNGANMKVSAKKSATAHILVRCAAYKEMDNKSMPQRIIEEQTCLRVHAGKNT